MKANDRWNRRIYAFWAPVYDWLVAMPFFVRGRRQAIEFLGLEPGEKILIVGVGTGADFPFLPQEISVTGIDLTPAMLNRARKKLPVAGVEIELLEGNAADLPFEDGQFDAVILSLILTVVPDGAACFREALRVLRPGGRCAVFDKFRPEDRGPSVIWRVLNVLTSFFGTDINRRFGEITEGAEFEVVREESGSSLYRVFLLRKPETE